MSKMAELDAAAAELRSCGEALIRISDDIRSLFSADDEQTIRKDPVIQQEPTAKPLTLEDVRPVLAQKSIEGHTAEVQALIRKHGAEKLSQIDPADYAALLAEAEVL